MKLLVAYDGTLQSQDALRYGIEKARERGGEVLVLHVFNSGLFLDYEGGPGAADIARSESARHIETARKIITEAAENVPVRIVIDEGNPEKEIVRYARTEDADIVISPPRYKSLMKSAPCSVSLIPGTILVPVDNTENSIMILDRITREARAARSSVILLGIVPIHLYNQWEKKEVSQVKAETLARIKQVRKLLVEQGIEVRDVLRSGYPDEEIVRTADEYSVSMIIMPGGGKEPSELSKAVNILLDEPEQVKMPVVLVPAQGTTA